MASSILEKKKQKNGTPLGKGPDNDSIACQRKKKKRREKRGGGTVTGTKKGRRPFLGHRAKKLILHTSLFMERRGKTQVIEGEENRYGRV